MSDIYGIAKSGLQAYKEGLATTGQNIANVGNDAYARREATISEIKSGSDILQLSNTAGYGVKIDGITRSFDQFIENQLHTATSGFSFSTAQATVLNQLEQVVRPSQGTVSQKIQELFSSLNSVAQDPSELAGRHVAVDAAKSLVSSIKTAAIGILDLKNFVRESIANDVAEANGVLQKLAEIQKEVLGNVGGNNVPNDLLDQRDNLLNNLSELIDVTITYEPGGAVKVNAGTSGQGQSLISGASVSSLEVQIVDGNSKIFLSSPNSAALSKIQVQAGKIAGSLASDITLNETKDALDDLTRKMVREINEVHAFGVDLNGKVGEQFFTLDGTQIEKYGDMKSSSQLDISGSIQKLIGNSYSLNYSAAEDKWILRNQQGIEVERFEQSLQFEGISLNITGQASIGDRFDLKFTDGLSENLNLQIKDGSQLAASSFYLVERGHDNQSSVNAVISRFEENEQSQLVDLNNIFVGSRNSANPSNFIQNGVIGVFKEIDSISNLTSIKTQPKIQFGTSVSNLNNATELRLTLNNVESVFSLGTLASTINNFSDLAEYLNDGVIRDANNKSFTDLGLYAGGNKTTLSITSAATPNNSSYPTLNSGSFAGSTGIIIPAELESADLQIFTREGVHLAGKALSQEQISKYLSVENGFSQDARYVADYLTTRPDNQYIGASVSRLTADGNHVASISSIGTATSVNSNLSVGATAAFPSSRNLMASPLQITTSSGAVVSFEPKQGMMAGNIASSLTAEIKAYGLEARASNRLELFDISNGNIQFDLMGNNSSGVSISAAVTNGDTNALVDEINKNSEVTGIQAFRSGSGAVILQKDDGNDIAITNVTTANNSNFLARQLDDFGEVVKASAINSPLTVSSGKYIVSGGQIKITSSSSFNVASGANSVSSQVSEFDSGFVTKKFDAANRQTNFSFEVLPDIDGNFVDEAGLIAVAASSSYSFELSTDNANQKNIVEFKPNSKQELTSAKVAEEIVSKLRIASPQTNFYGNEFNFSSGFPADGSSLEFKLGDQVYFATLQNQLEYSVNGNQVIIDNKSYSQAEALEQLVNASNFHITGPEKDRIFVGFESHGAGFRIYASAKDGTITGDGIRLSENNSTSKKGLFHIDEGAGNTTTVISGGEFDLQQAAKADFAKVVVGNTTINLSFDPNSNPKLSQSANIAGITIQIEEIGNNKGKLKVSIDQSTANLDVKLKATNNSATFGLITSSAQIASNENGFSVTNIDSERVETSADVKSLANEKLSITGIGGEDLIVLATGTGKVSLLGDAKKADYVLNPRELSAKVSSSSQNIMEISDLLTGDFLGSRKINDSNDFLFRDFRWQFDGNLSSGEVFNIRTSTERRDDASNLKDLISLSDFSTASGKGGYSQLYSDLVIDVGFDLRSSEQGLETSKVLFDVATDRKSVFSGVDLDTEAAKLLEQQQAYQALAKVLSTAKEMVDTLLRSM